MLKKLTAYELCLIGVFAALTVVMAQISIPMPLGVPMTMQTFAVSLAGIILGPRRGFLSALTYLMLGAAGLPVFAGFNGGIGAFAGPTGGFLLSFPLMAWFSGLGVEKSRPGLFAALGLVSGTVVNFICGALVFSAVTGAGYTAAFNACILPFLPTAVIKAAAAGVIGLKLRTRKIFIAHP